MGDEVSLPINLQNLTGIGREILINRRALWQLGLIHSDDQPFRSLYRSNFLAQMTDLQRFAVRTLG